MNREGDLDAVIAAERARTTARIEGLTRDFDAIVESVTLDPPDDEHDPEGATTAFERQQIAALLASARRHLAELDHAQERLRAGEYGACERCGQPIALARLEARPTARRCVACAALDEPRAR